MNNPSTDTAAEELENLTGLTVKLGYIGNLETWGDDRRWYVWIAEARDNRGNLVSLGSSDTAHTYELAEACTVENLAAALARPGVTPSIVYGSNGDTVRTYRESAALVEAVSA